MAMGMKCGTKRFAVWREATEAVVEGEMGEHGRRRRLSIYERG